MTLVVPGAGEVFTETSPKDGPTPRDLTFSPINYFLNFKFVTLMENVTDCFRDIY